MSLPMFDISSINHISNKPFNFKQAVKDGYKGVMIKATEGTTYTNPWLKTDADAAHSAGLALGFYHFAHPGHSTPAEQVAYFISKITGLPRSLGLVLDLEVEELPTWAETSSWGEEFLNLLTPQAKLTTLYSNYNFLNNMPGSPWKHKLWLASPSYAPRRACWMWQKAPGTIKGIDGLVDIDLYNG